MTDTDALFALFEMTEDGRPMLLRAAHVETLLGISASDRLYLERHELLVPLPRRGDGHRRYTWEAVAQAAELCGIPLPDPPGYSDE